MSIEKSNFGDAASASVTRGAQHNETLGIQGWYDVKCFDSEGNLKWEDKAPNLVTAVGKQALFDYYFGATGTAGGTASGTNYLGLCGGTATYTAADTMASHTWTEVGLANAPTYTGNRQSVNWTAASSTGSTPSNVTTSAAAAITYTITGAGGTVGGCFLNIGGTSAQSNTTGTLYSAGAFATAKITTAGDTVSVTYSTTATS